MKHQDKSNSLLEKVQHIIKNLCDKGGGSIALLSWLSIVLSVLFDQCRQEYWFPELELIFHRQPEEFSDLGTFIFAIWAVSITFIVFFLGVVNDRRYGIRIIDIVLVGRNAYVNLVCKAISCGVDCNALGRFVLQGDYNYSLSLYADSLDGLFFWDDLLCNVREDNT